MGTAPPPAKVSVTVVPDCTALVLTIPNGALADGPPDGWLTRLSWKAALMPLGKVTASLNVTFNDVTIDRWAEPSLICKETTVGGVGWVTLYDSPVTGRPPRALPAVSATPVVDTK